MAHRYVKLRVLSTIGVISSTSIASLEFATVIGGPNLATVGGKATTSYPNTIAPLTRAFDGDDATYHQSSGYSASSQTDDELKKSFSVNIASPLNIIYDFGTPIEVAEMRIMPRVTGSIADPGTPRTMMLYVSNDNLNWEFLAYFIQTTYETSKKSFSVEAYRQKPVSNRLFKDFYIKPLVRQQPVKIGPIGFHDIYNGKLYRKITNPYSGAATIKGVTTVLGQPISRKVALYDQRNWGLIAITYSSDDGKFEFNLLREGTYSIVGIDMTANQNSVIFAHVEAINQ